LPIVLIQEAKMLDYNKRPKLSKLINDHIDAVLIAERDATPSRTYLGASRLGVSCERALQFEFTNAPKDDGGDFSGQVLRIFAIGHMLEDLAIRWLRGAGFDLYTQKTDGGQFGFSVADGRIRGHVDGIIAAGPEDLGIAVPALWECKTMNARNWRETVKKGVSLSKPVYAAQIAIYQAYMEPSVPEISAAPALFTAINKDTAELYHEMVPFDAALAQRMSDRAVRILQATDAGDLLPRVANNRDFFECRFCSYADRCWKQDQ
jgi:PD-(D/E)XK nuclease superfamily